MFIGLEQAKRVVNGMRERGVLISAAGPLESILKISAVAGVRTFARRSAERSAASAGLSQSGPLKELGGHRFR